jgi:hypothetical protein
MSKQNAVLRNAGQFIADPSEAPIDFGQVLDELGYAGERVPAEELVGKTFVITRAKPYRSSFDRDRMVYFCVFHLEGSEQEFTTSLGGTAIVNALTEVIGLGMISPLRVTLLRRDGKTDQERYYYFG